MKRSAHPHVAKPRFIAEGCFISEAPSCAEGALHSKNAPLSQDNSAFLLVPEAGVEPARYRYHWILSPARLPIPSFRRIAAISRRVFVNNYSASAVSATASSATASSAASSAGSSLRRIHRVNGFWCPYRKHPSGSIHCAGYHPSGVHKAPVVPSWEYRPGASASPH